MIPMRIGFDASPLRKYQSGVGHYAASLLGALSTEFPEREYLVLSHLPDYVPRAVNLIRTQKLPFPIKEIWMQAWVPRILAHYQPDLCHFTNSVAPLRAQVPYVVTVHDLSLIRHPEWHPWTRRIWMRRLIRPAILGARVVLCDSEATRADLRAWLHLPSSRLCVVPLGARRIFNRVCSQEQKEAVLQKHRLTSPFFFYLGNIEPRKNLPLLLEAFGQSNLNQVDLVLAGRRAWLWKDVARSLGTLRIQSRVRFLDYVEDDDLPALLQTALAFVYPSRMEGFGLPVLEAMTSGAAVVVARIEPLTSLVGDAGWTADVDDPQQWRSALEEAWRDKEKRVVLAARGQERARQYTWEAAARATMRCYEGALSAS
jgi:alpha-1,3-rhamnosyl/mannosyltransferase